MGKNTKVKNQENTLPKTLNEGMKTPEKSKPTSG